jgi:hypothetical protein
MARMRIVLFLAFLAVAGATAGGAGSAQTLPGLMTGKDVAAWGANNGAALKARLEAIGLPALPKEALNFHVHQRMAVLVNGKFVYIPAGIGIDANAKFISELHTHDATGIIHVEAPKAQKFTLGQFFDVWGLRFSAKCLGGYCAKGKRQVMVWTNGRRVLGDPRKVVLKSHLSIVVAYGTEKSVPKPIPAHFPFPKGY